MRISKLLSYLRLVYKNGEHSSYLNRRVEGLLNLLGRGRADVSGMPLARSSNDAIRFHARSRILYVASFSDMLHLGCGKMASRQLQAPCSL